MQPRITLTKRRGSVSRSVATTLIIIALLAFFISSDYRATGTLTGFGWLGILAMIAGIVAIAQQYFSFSRAPSVLELDLAQRAVIDTNTQHKLADFDTLTFFALGTAKTNALIECHLGGQMVMRLRRYYELPSSIATLLAKYAHVEGVELKFIGLTK